MKDEGRCFHDRDFRHFDIVHFHYDDYEDENCFVHYNNNNKLKRRLEDIVIETRVTES